MSRPILEVIALDAEDALAAQAGGADRLELVADMAADGLTPSRETFAEVRAAVGLPLRVMLRAGAGFTLDGAEAGGSAEALLDLLCEQAAALRSEGAEEFVFGYLDEEGRPDLRALTALTGATGHSPWTFHRAVDRAADRDGLRKALAALSGDGTRGGAPDTYLTAGSAQGVDSGLGVLRAEAARAAAGEPGYEATTLAGGGLRLEHVTHLAAAGVTAFHIGGAARRAGWDSPVDAARVREWRAAVDGAVEDGEVPVTA